MTSKVVQLVEQVEDRYGSLLNVPDDELIKLQNQVNQGCCDVDTYEQATIKAIGHLYYQGHSTREIAQLYGHSTGWVRLRKQCYDETQKSHQ